MSVDLYINISRKAWLLCTCEAHGEQQQSGGEEGLACQEEGAGVGVGQGGFRRPAEGKHQTQRTSAQSHQTGNESKYSLCFQSCNREKVQIINLYHTSTKKSKVGV